jgi:hypothetical protein
MLKLKGFSRKDRVPSTYWIIGNPLPQNLLPRGWQRFPNRSSALMTDCSKSALKTKSKGDKGSPCLTSLLQRKGFPGIPFRSTDEEPEDKMALIQEIQLDENSYDA